MTNFFVNKKTYVQDIFKPDTNAEIVLKNLERFRRCGSPNSKLSTRMSAHFMNVLFFFLEKNFFKISVHLYCGVAVILCSRQSVHWFPWVTRKTRFGVSVKLDHFWPLWHPPKGLMRAKRIFPKTRFRAVWANDARIRWPKNQCEHTLRFLRANTYVRI